MELTKETYNKVLDLISDAKKNKNYELEVRFWGKDKIITEENYKKIFQKLTFSTENNGLGLSYIMKNNLDVTEYKKKSDYTNDISDNSSLRMTILDPNDIKKYWLQSNTENINIEFIEKEKLDKIDDYNYNIRFSLNNELPEQNIIEKNMNFLKDISNNTEKLFRLKNRYSIKTSDNLFLIDLTSVKSGIGKDFKSSNTLKSVSKYEIEIEYIGGEINKTPEEISKSMFYYINLILIILHDNNPLLSSTLITSIKDNYKKLIGISGKNKNTNDFIAANPVTIHRENLLKSDEVKNIYNKYAITLKADGSRNFLIVHASDNKDDNGKIYIFNNNFEIIDTGFKDPNYINTLIEGEYVNNNEQTDFFMYDILFYKDEDVRRRHLININKGKEGKQESRLELIDIFMKSNTRIKSDESISSFINIKKKPYKWSVRSDGTDIFQKVKEIWDTRNFSLFHVDGIIFVPIFEYYPLRGGAWPSLLKWKPPELNTIDFLIKINKDDNNNDIKSPYIETIKRPDGKTETLLKQYKSIRLYVSGHKVIFNNKIHQKYKKYIPVLFNPFGMDDTNSEAYNLVKIFVDDSEKIYALDPITNEKIEIYDDIIVEFGFDEGREHGFQWLPYRFRKDKTNLYKSGKPVFGNSENTANDIFKSIKRPVTEEMITSGIVPISQSKDEINLKPYYVELGNADNNNTKRERYAYQNFHNHYIKFQLYYFSSPAYINEYSSGTHGKLLDLCCGKGVDITKIKKARYAEVVGMDIDIANVRYAQDYYKSIVPSPKPKAYYVRGDSGNLIWPEQASAFTETDKVYTKKFIPTKYFFDTVSVQFCFHYFFENEIRLRSIIQNMNDNLKIGGFVIGTCFDGEQIYELLKSSQEISGKTPSGEIMWRIEKKYSTPKKPQSTETVFTEKKANYGKEIDVFVKTIGQIHKEYLVNFKFLDNIMKEYGFSKVSVKPFEEFYNELINGENLMKMPEKDFLKNVDVAKNMSEDQKRFSFLSSGFIYKKEKNSSDALFKKLVTLMEKKDKLKKVGNEEVSGVTKVDGDLEHTIEYLASPIP
jgi:SAM-dependent methyltransferase